MQNAKVKMAEVLCDFAFCILRFAFLLYRVALRRELLHERFPAHEETMLFYCGGQCPPYKFTPEWDRPP